MMETQAQQGARVELKPVEPSELIGVMGGYFEQDNLYHTGTRPVVIPDILLHIVALIRRG